MIIFHECDTCKHQNTDVCNTCFVISCTGKRYLKKFIHLKSHEEYIQAVKGLGLKEESE